MAESNSELTNVLAAVEVLAGALNNVSNASVRRIEALELDRDQAETERDELRAYVWDALGWDVDDTKQARTSRDAAEAIKRWRDQAEGAKADNGAESQLAAIFDALADWLQLPGSPSWGTIWAAARRRLDPAAGTGQAQRIPAERTQGPQDERRDEIGPAGPMGQSRSPEAPRTSAAAGRPGMAAEDYEAPAEAIRASVLDLVRLVESLGPVVRLSTAVEPAGPDGLTIESITISYLTEADPEPEGADGADEMTTARRFAPFRVQLCKGLGLRPANASNHEILAAVEEYLNN